MLMVHLHQRKPKRVFEKSSVMFNYLINKVLLNWHLTCKAIEVNCAVQ